MPIPREYAAPVGPQSIQNRPNSVLPSSEVFGFPVAVNQYNAFSEQSAVESNSQVQGVETLVNPRTTRLQRFQAARQAAARGSQQNEGILD